MSVAYYAEIPSITREQIEQVTGFINEHVGETGPEGSLFHADGPTDGGGWWAFELFVSEDEFDRFNQDILTPAFTQAGIGAPMYRRLEVTWNTIEIPG
jgi:hypothetical protein